ncbi:MAG: response regulator [Parcubacteria group bacterium]|jgi:DNA-binding response OmpR family regulator
MINNKIKVLFVEDDPEQVFLFSKVFDIKGLLTMPATTSEEVFKVISWDRPDIVLLDVMLRNENGLDIMEKLRNDSRVKGVPIFVFTNTDKKEYKDRAEKLGAEDYIIKANTTPQEMVERIKRFVKDGGVI